MRGNIFILFSLLIIVSCSEENLPNGIYDYQVERLLSGQTGEKTWSQVINSENCTDSIQLVVSLVANSTDDSLDLSFVSGCSSAAVTTVIGRASASGLGDGILFTDSLNFSDGSFWIVNQVTSQQLILEIVDQSVQFESQ